MKTLIRNLVRREDGQSLILLSAALPVMIAMLAVTLDGGAMLSKRRTVQAAADASALAAGQDLKDVGDCADRICFPEIDTTVACDAAVYADMNGVPQHTPYDPSDSPCLTALVTEHAVYPLHECDPADPNSDWNCWIWPYKSDNQKIKIKLRTRAETPFASAAGITDGWNVSASAVGSVIPEYEITPESYSTESSPDIPIPDDYVTDPGTTVHDSYVTSYGTTVPPTTIVGSTVTTGGPPAAIFARSSKCTGSFFIPGSGNYVTGVWTNGGVGNIGGSGNVVDGIRANEFWNTGANAGRCINVNSGSTVKNITWGPPADDWLVPYPSLESMFQSPDSHCLMSNQTISSESYSGGTVTLTTNRPHCLEVGKTVAVNITEARFDGNFVVTGRTAKTFSFAKTIAVAKVSNKLLQSGTATLTTAAAHNLVVGDSVLVNNVGDAAFDGTYDVTAVPSTTTFRYTPTPVVKDVTRKSVTGGVATLTTETAHGLVAGRTVTVAIGDARFDGTYVVSAVGSSTTFSYVAAVLLKSYVVANNVATLTVASPPHGFQVGDSITVAGVANALNGTWTVTGVTSSTITYDDKTANVKSTNTSGTVKLATFPSTATSGSVTLVGVPSTAVSPQGDVTLQPISSRATTGTSSFSVANAQTISSAAWKTANPPGIYVIDAGNGVALTISASGVDLSGYTFVAPEILVSGSNLTFKNFANAPQLAVFYAYDPNGDAVHVNGTTTNNKITGSMLCGPAVAPTGTTPGNKCWVGGTGAVFDGLMEGWVIEYTVSNATFNGSGPGTGTTTTVYGTTVIPGTTVGDSVSTIYGTTVLPSTISTITGTTIPGWTTTITHPASTSVTGTNYGLDE